MEERDEVLNEITLLKGYFLKKKSGIKMNPHLLETYKDLEYKYISYLSKASESIKWFYVSKVVLGMSDQMLMEEMEIDKKNLEKLEAELITYVENLKRRI